VFPHLQAVLDAAGSGVPAPAWEKAAERVETERAAVEHMLRSSPGRAVYGFTTLLGPLDGIPGDADDAPALLQAHLVGRAEPISPVMTRLITCAKLAQLAAGGSGISPTTYRTLLEAVADPPSCAIAWGASYGSADVVPAAWWAHALVPDPDVLEVGDLVALLNGHFLSTAHAVTTLVDLTAFLGRFCSVAGTVVAPIPRELGAPAARELVAAMAWNYVPVEHERQLPVSIRDSGVYAQPVPQALAELTQALESRLAWPSGNPLFDMASGKAEPFSQAGFLDVGLTMRLTAVRQLVLYCMGAVQRFTEVWCTLLAQDQRADDPRFVQPPKVSQAILEDARTGAGPISVFSGSQSGGVEDLWDCSLIASRSLATVVDLAEQQIDVLLAVLDTSHARPRLGGAEFTRMLLEETGLTIPGSLRNALRQNT
jgi:histidine ammonia-lyase